MMAAPALAQTNDEAFAARLAPLLQAGDHADALRILDSRPDLAARPDGLRLKAELLFRTGRTDRAVGLLEGHLAQDQTDALARYQLAEMSFAAGRYGQATLAYRLALAGALDPARRQIAEARLRAIEDRRGWRLSGGMAIVPDSNINSATGASSVEMFGLPFTLADDARRRSGVSASANLAAERQVALGRGLDLVGSAALAGVDAPESDYDYITAGAAAGLQKRLPSDALVSLQATWRERWYGGEPLDARPGLRLTGQHFTTTATRWDASLEAERIDSRRSPAFDGRSVAASLGRTRYLGPSALWRASVGWSAQDVGLDSEGYAQAYVSAGRLTGLPFALMGYGEAYAMRREFAAASPVFGLRRHDVEVGASFRLSKRNWAIRGAFPFAQLTLSRADSNLTLGRYSRERLEVGFTRDF